MALTDSTMMLPLGTSAPDFRLPDTEGKEVGLVEVMGEQGIVVAFICNHCPYVIHIQHRLVEVAREYMAKGIGFVGISSNDVTVYPEDAPERMKEEKTRIGYPFRAACTPDLYVFDGERRLVYTGQFDGTRPERGRPSGEDLKAALDALLEGRTLPAERQRPSAGCNIKWKPGNAPEYYG
jgi:thiol-disulfide isomerase/thioredoxin